jgi:uncharacterized caspase-like protein
MSNSNERKRIALIIGNANYSHARGLKNADSDAAALAATLQKLKFVSHEQDESLNAYDNQSMAGMMRLLGEFSIAACKAEMAVIYYSGHGIEVAGKNYLIPVDAVIDHVAMLDYQRAAAWDRPRTPDALWWSA